MEIVKNLVVAIVGRAIGIIFMMVGLMIDIVLLPFLVLSILVRARKDK